MKKIMMIFSALILLFGITGCKRQEYSDQMSNIMENEILYEWSQKYPMYDRSEFQIKIFYGSYDEAYVLHIEPPGVFAEAIYEVTVAGYEFVYPMILELTVYYKGQFYWLSDAYEEGILTKHSVKMIKEKYDSYSLGEQLGPVD